MTKIKPLTLDKTWRFYSAHFILGESTRKQQTMVKLQLAANAIAKSRSQIKPQPVKGSSINTILIFSMVDVPGCSSCCDCCGQAFL